MMVGLARQSAVFLLVLVALSLASEAPGARADVEGDREAAALVDAQFARLSRFSANIERELKTKGFGAIARSRARIYIHRPARLRIDYSEPKGKSITLNGSRGWFFDPESQTVYIWNQVGALEGDPALSLLIGSRRPSELFKIRRLASPSARADELVYKLIPRSSGMNIKGIAIALDRGDQTLRSLKIVDNLGNVSQLLFDQVEYSRPIAPERFVYKVPGGAKVERIKSLDRIADQIR